MAHAAIRQRTGKSSARRARHAREEGAVMLVVMLILMIATASAAVSVHTTQSELHAAGEERIAMQSRYASEVAMMSTIAWIDRAGETDALAQYWFAAGAQPLPPPMQNYAEPEIATLDRHEASRTNMLAQGLSQKSTSGEIFPLSDATTLGSGGGSGSSGGGGSSGSGGSTVADALGSFGPRQAYVMPAGGFIVDINDCARAPNPPGQPVTTPAGQPIRQFNCVITAHAGIQLPGSVGTRNWTFGGSTYAQDPFLSAHDSRAAILTPPIIGP